MSLLKDFKADVSQAVNELMDDDGTERTDEVTDEMSALFGSDTPEKDGDGSDHQEPGDADSEEDSESVEDKEEEDVAKKNDDRNLKPEDSKQENVTEQEQNDAQNTEKTDDVVVDKADFDAAPADDETATITRGTEIKGDIKTTGSLDILGKINGNVDAKGKLVVSGAVTGTSSAAEIFTDAANVNGDMISSGSIKIGVGSVVVGNLKATSAVIAGAVKGDIDVDGPIIVDSTAVVMGNIKSRSVQVNNGAVMEGMCSQSYSDIDVNSFFEN